MGYMWILLQYTLSHILSTLGGQYDYKPLNPKPLIVVSIFFSIIPIQPQYIPYNPYITHYSKGTLMGTPNREPPEYSRNIIGIYLPGSLYSVKFLLYSWGSLFGVPIGVPLYSRGAIEVSGSKG